MNLFTGLATAGLIEDSLPLDIGLVVGVDGGRDVEGILQDLAGAGVDHGPLETESARAPNSVTGMAQDLPE